MQREHYAPMSDHFASVTGMWLPFLGTHVWLVARAAKVHPPLEGSFSRVSRQGLGQVVATLTPNVNFIPNLGCHPRC